jgi:hypothetical protein
MVIQFVQVKSGSIDRLPSICAEGPLLPKRSFLFHFDQYDQYAAQ